MPSVRTRAFISVLAVSIAGVVQATAGGHTWRLSEAFSNADGSIQFIELRESAGTAFETSINRVVSSTTNVSPTVASVVGPTNFKSILLATASFAALPGAPTPDYIIVPNFFNPVGDTLQLSGLDSWAISAVPTDGILSLNRALGTSHPGGTRANSPTNYAGVTGSVDASPPAPPAVPDSMSVLAMDPAGSALEITFDEATCSSSASHHILHGDGSSLPTTPGGAFALSGSVCAIGASPYLWESSPEPGVGEFTWWVIVRSVGSVEGSWGLDSAGVERVGPGAGGMSGECSATSRSVTNTCGQ
jgi:hypothetical protein